MTSGLALPWRNSGQGCHSRLCLPIWDFPRVVLAFRYIKLSMIEAKVCNDHHDELPSLPHFQSWPWGRTPSRFPKLTLQRLSGGIMWNRERQILYDFTYMWNLKNITEKKQTLNQKTNKLVATSGEKEGGGAEQGWGSRRCELLGIR